MLDPAADSEGGEHDGQVGVDGVPGPVVNGPGLQDNIRAEAHKLIRRHERYAQLLAEETERRQRRTTVNLPPLAVMRPAHWELAAAFNPYLVRARAQTISHAIKERLAARTYTPLPPVGFPVPKKDGGLRLVSVFPVADNAVSQCYFKSLLRKNHPRLSSRSYAYREDLTVHDAIQYIQAEFAARQRLFIAEYDFRDYFNSIEHEYLYELLDEQRFLITQREMQVIKSFLTAPEPRTVHNYSLSATARARGVPQGTSISLFLANVAASPLDRSLEHLGVGFVRYADDTLIWSDDYMRICEAVDRLHETSKAIGSEVNLAKSEGVRLLTQPGARAEMVSATQVNFVGYKVALNVLDMRGSTVEKVKEHLRQLLFFNVLDVPLRGRIDPKRLGRVDRDYYVFILQARRYLYGDLSEKELRRLQAKGSPLKYFKGLMSFYPLVEDTKTLTELDGWLASQAWLTMRRRASILRDQGFTSSTT